MTKKTIGNAEKATEEKGNIYFPTDADWLAAAEHFDRTREYPLPEDCPRCGQATNNADGRRHPLC